VLRKRIDTRRLEAMGWYPSIDFDDGLRQTYEWFNRERPQGSAVAEASLYC
jgi:dTDP-D-glucose 4,6-dehydratase